MRLKRRCNTDCQTQTKACLLRSLYLQKYNVINERDMGYAGAGENICLAGSWMVGGEHGVGTSDRHERASVMHSSDRRIRHIIMARRERWRSPGRLRPIPLRVFNRACWILFCSSMLPATLRLSIPSLAPDNGRSQTSRS